MDWESILLILVVLSAALAVYVMSDELSDRRDASTPEPRATNIDLENSEALRLEQLKLEVSELRASPDRVRATNRLASWTASLAATTTLAIAVGGWIIGWTIQRESDRQHETDAYNAFLEALGKNNAAVRVGAVVGLATHIKTGDPLSEQTTAVLLARLNTDNSPTVLQEIIQRLGSAGAIIIPQALDAQHRAYWSFHYALIQYARELAIEGCSKGTASPSDYISLALNNRLNNAVTVVLPPESSAPTPQLYGTESWLNQEQLDALQRVVLAPGATCGDTVQALPGYLVSEHTVPNPAPTLSWLNEVIGIGSILSTVLATESGSLRAQDLDYAIITNLTAGGRNLLDLRGYHLAAAFLAGSGKYVDFSRANLSDADLFSLDLDKSTSFQGSVLTRTRLNARLFDPSDGGVLPNFSGAKWWNATLEAFDGTVLSPYGCNGAVIAIRSRYPIPGHIIKCANRSSSHH
jgi:hypothetical protein